MSRSYVGASVRLRREVRTKGGTKFREGTLMKVSGSEGRGGLSLYCYKRGFRMSIRGVNRSDVVVVSWPPRED